jgi:hypothetical protein
MAEHARLQREYSCQEVVELVSDYIEGAMTPAQMTALELHLNFCDGCFALVDQVRQTAAMASVLPEEEIPAEIKTKLLEAFNDWKCE